LISVKPEYFGRMMSGIKTVELRRRPIRVPIGTTVWIYETVPSGRVGAMAEISAVEEDTPAEIWNRYGDRTGISRQVFFSYFAGSKHGCALVFRQILPLRKPLALASLRGTLGAFAAPQFYRKLKSNGPELRLFKRSVLGVPCASSTDCYTQHLPP
jgi:predicted transcriptional regulator